MSQVILISTVSLFASFLTFFSGFGLGTLLLPVFALFFPIELAITLTAIVHFLNNIFKTSLTYKSINYEVVKKFGIPSIIGAFAGSISLMYMVNYFKEFEYELFEITLNTSALKIIIGLLIFIFAIVELARLDHLVKGNSLFLLSGGIISGFFGGISGHQGALRTLFLSKFNLNKDAFIASGIAIALLVDFTRIPIYLADNTSANLQHQILIILAAVIPAFLGAIIGKYFLKKIKIQFLYKLVSVCLV